MKNVDDINVLIFVYSVCNLFHYFIVVASISSELFKNF